MQWLIDIIKEWIIAKGYLTTGYHCRYIWQGPDFDLEDLDTDGGIHTLDLSHIVPAGAKSVNLSIRVTSPSTQSVVRIFHPDSTVMQYRCIIYTQVANISFRAIQAIGIDDNRHVKYYFTDVGWTFAAINIRGWWF